MKTLSVEQANYIAGFLDGDGSILAQIVPRTDYVLKYQIRVSVTFTQKTNRIHHLKKFQNEIGTGTVRDRGDGIAEFAMVGHKTVMMFLKQIQPYLRNKQKQANLVIRICEQLDLTDRNPARFLELCKFADHVADLNDSKNRTITTEIVKQTFNELGLMNP